MNATASTAPGTLLAGKYRVDRVLGEGGMGVVLAATNEALRQRVAIKLLRSGALANAKALGRFEREAHAAASLRSEHVARVVDVGKLPDGRPYMVMEYLEGRDLGDVIDDVRPVGVGEAVEYVLQACEAIAEAHASGIIHRDLKPRNLFLTSTIDGRPLIKVLDFGISKIETDAEDLSLTRTTEVIGSPSYMSPEQLKASKDVDVRTDIWALGVILYELLTKSVPFLADTVTQLVAVVLTEPVPDVRVTRPDVPEQLAQIISMCMAKRREDRIQSVAQLVRLIAPFGGGSVASIVDRVDRVAMGSGKSLPPCDTGSGPYTALNPGTGGTGTSRLSGSPAHGSSASSSSNRSNASNASNASGGGAAGISASGASSSDPANVPSASGVPPNASSSARLAIHGGTSVAWGETEVDHAKSLRRSRLPRLIGAAALVVVTTAGGTGAFLYARHAREAPTTAAPPPPESVTMPIGRKDLPPLAGDPASTASGALTTALPPSALPTTRVPVTTATTLATAEPRPPDPRPRPKPAGNTGRGNGAQPPPMLTKPPDDLSDIGRR